MDPPSPPPPQVNYCSNAIRHARSQVLLRVVTVATERAAGGAAEWGKCQKDQKDPSAGTLLLRVEAHDDGDGVPNDLKPKLFRPAARGAFRDGFRDHARVWGPRTLLCGTRRSGTHG